MCCLILRAVAYGGRVGGMDDRTWTVAQLAAYLQVHEETVRRWIRGGMPALNVGSRQRPDYRIEPNVARCWIARRQQPETANDADA